jgi:hypothetical protein
MTEIALIYLRKSAVPYADDLASPERQPENCIRTSEEKRGRADLYEVPVAVVNSLHLAREHNRLLHNHDALLQHKPNPRPL